MTKTIYHQIYDAHLDREFETILIKLLQYNLSPIVEAPVCHFLRQYVEVRNTFWHQFENSSSFDMVFDLYDQYTKNKNMLIDSLLDNLNFALSYDPLRNDLSVIMKDSLTF